MDPDSRAKDTNLHFCPREQDSLCIWPKCDHPKRCLLPNVASQTTPWWRFWNPQSGIGGAMVIIVTAYVLTYLLMWWTHG